MDSTVYDGLEKLFHEPKRMAIMSHLCHATKGASFANLKKACDLTDGNLNRHLHTLEEADAVRLVKTQVKSRPLTTVFLTEAGRNGFLNYLLALEKALVDAVSSLEPEEAEVVAAPLYEGIIF